MNFYFLPLRKRAASKIKALKNAITLFFDEDNTLKYKDGNGNVNPVAPEAPSIEFATAQEVLTGTVTNKVISPATKNGGVTVYKGLLNSTPGAITKTNLVGSYNGAFYIDEISGSTVTVIIGESGDLANAIITIGNQRRDTLPDTPHFLYYNDAGFWVLQYTDNSFYKTEITIEIYP